MLLINSSSEIGSLLPENLLAKTLFTSISLTLQSEEVISRGIMFPNIRGSGTWWKFSQSVISCGKIGMVNVQYGVHSYPNADGTKPFQTRGRTMKIIKITAITAICTCCPRSQFPSASVSVLEYQGSDTLSTAQWWGKGIYCIVDTSTKADNLVIELKSHIIVLHPMFLIRKNVTLLTC